MWAGRHCQIKKKINSGVAEDTFVECESEGTVKYFKPACAVTNPKLAAAAKAKTDDDAQGATPVHLSDLSAGADKEFLGAIEKLLHDQRDVILQRIEVCLLKRNEME